MGIIILIGVGLLSTVAGKNAYILGLWLSLMVQREEFVITMLSLKKTLDDGYYYYFGKKCLLLMHLLPNILKLKVV